MDLDKLYNPIAIPKPVKARELRTTVIKRDGIGAIQLIPEESGATKPEDDVEIYHEGYIEGKLYLVPDINLQAMRDIVNLKMRRRLSSRMKPETSLGEPTQYNEFNFKLDTLLGKIDRLAGDSSEEEIQDKHESPEDIEREPKEMALEKKVDLQPINKKDEIFLEEESGKFEYNTLPPILDKRIKYKRVKAKKEFKDKYSEIESGSVAKLSQSLTSQLGIPSHPSLSTELTQDIFTLLISGHIKPGENPMFIIQHYNGRNILGNQTPDFKSHKTEGNIDISLKGKFFTEYILEKSLNSSVSVINLKPEKILLNKNCRIYTEKFRDVFDIGPVDIALEGEFLKSKETLKYTPMISLEILKHCFKHEYRVSSTQVLFTKDSHHSPFEEAAKIYSEGGEKQQSIDVESETNILVTNMLKPKQQKNGFLKKITPSFIYQKIFEKNKDVLKDVTSYDNKNHSKFKPKTNKKEKLPKGGTAKEKLQRRMSMKQEGQKSPDKYRECKKAGGTQATPNNADKPVRRRRKKDKNEAIIENPILAQVQEFFIA